VKKQKKPATKRYFHYFHIVHDNNTYLYKRDRSDIWKNLYEFPLIETRMPMDFVQLRQTEEYQALFSGIPSLPGTHPLMLKHKLSHQEIHTSFYRIVIPEKFHFRPPQNIIRTEIGNLSEYPISRLTHKYLETI
jgi:hypothetical protein